MSRQYGSFFKAAKPLWSDPGCLLLLLRCCLPGRSTCQIMRPCLHVQCLQSDRLLHVQWTCSSLRALVLGGDMKGCKHCNAMTPLPEEPWSWVQPAEQTGQAPGFFGHVMRSAMFCSYLTHSLKVSTCFNMLNSFGQFRTFWCSGPIPRYLADTSFPKAPARPKLG